MVNRYTTPIQNTLEEYIPLPLQSMLQAGAAIQQRGDLAEQQNIQTETGLASIEALAPAYQRYRDNLVSNYRQQASALLDKYGGNTSNPEFIRDMRRLNSSVISDPRLQTIKQGNELYRQNQQIAAKMKAEGRLFINPQFTGIDDRGNLTASVPQVEGVNTLQEWEDAFKVAHNSMEDNGKGWKTNKGNLDRTRSIIEHDIRTGGPQSRRLMQAYLSQGMTPQQAQQAVVANLSNLVNNYGIRSDKDWQYENFQLRLRELQSKQAQQQAIPNLLPFDEEYSQVVASDFRKPQIEKIDSALKNTNERGGIKRNTFTVADTPENRKKYAGKFKEQVFRVPGTSFGMGTTGGISQRELVVTGSYNKDQYDLVKEARSFLGAAAKNDKGNYLSDKTVLQKYKDIMSNDDTVYSFIKPNNAEYIKALTDIKVGSAGQNIGHEYTVFNADGDKITNDKKGENPLKGLKAFEFAGVNPTKFDKYEYGTIKINAIDENNNPVTILKPLNRQEKQIFSLPNQIYKLMNSDKTNEQLASEPIETQSGRLFIQKSPTPDGRVGVKAYLQNESGIQQIDVNSVIEGIMSKYYNTQQPYESLK